MHRTSVLRGLRLALPLAGLCSLAGAAETEPLPLFATQVPQQIRCENTPFGRTVRLGGEYEYTDFLAGSGLDLLEEYQPSGQPDPAPPLLRTYQNDIHPGALAGTTFLHAVAIDLDGDGRDEIVTANRVTADNTLRLGVFRRNAAGTGVDLIDTWSSGQAMPNASASIGVDLAVGDFDGSQDRQQELAVLTQTTTWGLRLQILSGNAAGFVQGDGVDLAHWSRTTAVSHFALAAGDMLLEGRDQVVVVDERDPGFSRTLNYTLVELDPATPALPVAGGDVRLGSRSFASPIGDTYEHDNGNTMISSISRLLAVAGDVVDSAAAELVVYTQFRNDSSDSNYIGQRLHHFTATRDDDRRITSISFFNRNGPGESGHEYDSSRFVQGDVQGALAAFDAVIADVDRLSPKELVVARATGNHVAGGDEGQEGSIEIGAYKARVDVHAGFRYSRTGYNAHFVDMSTGDIVQRTWAIDVDNNGSIDYTTADPDPYYVFQGNTTASVKLTVRDIDDATDTYTLILNIDGSGNAEGGLTTPEYAYHLYNDPFYKGVVPVESMSSVRNIALAVGDMDKDGQPEIMTLARTRTNQLTRSLWRLADGPGPGDPKLFAGRHIVQDGSTFENLTALDVVAADLDGDSVEFTVSTDCRMLVEAQVRQVVWMPPYFQRLQADAGKLASWGETTSTGSSSEHSSGSYTSHDISGSIGVSVGVNLFDLVDAEASAKATFGYYYQSAEGELHGSENTHEVDQGRSQDANEGLVVFDETGFNCYRYDVQSQADGVDPDSHVRLCEVIPDTRFTRTGSAVAWDKNIPAAPQDHPPAQWVPLQRDWNNLALFRPVTSNASFASGRGADHATDGRYQLDANAVESAGAGVEPYLQIDLGAVRDISNIRVLPANGHAGALTGFRVYASANPMSGAGVPGGGGVHVYASENEDDVSYERWNIWTRERTQPYNMLRARYIRLQHPGTTPADLRVAEIQVFGDVHAEPPAYPDGICDPVANDGFFQARVWNPLAGSFVNIDMRGDLAWRSRYGSTGVVPDCTQYSTPALPEWNIWNALAIGETGTDSWYLSDFNTTTTGHTTSTDSSTRVGAEFDQQAGFIATVHLSEAYEFTSGVTEEYQSTAYWGDGVNMGGEMTGYANDVLPAGVSCDYRPQPYAYRVTELSNTGYRHDIYAVDYFVHQGATQWQRDSVPSLCLHDDEIFGDGFD